MRIIIAGSGVTGTYLATLLSHEQHDIVLMDTDESKLLPLEANFDLMTLNYSPTSIHGLQKAGAKKADLFIAVTPDESCNIASCVLAHRIGAKKTVARINNCEYLDPQNIGFFKELGISSMIYPEVLAAKEIANTGSYSWIRQIYEVHNGQLLMIGVKMWDTSRLLNIPIRDLGASEKPYHIVAIQRKKDDSVVIPNGNDVIEYGDMVYFMTMKKSIPYLQKLCGKENYKDIRNVMIMGGGQMALETIKCMPSSFKLKVIEKDAARIDAIQGIVNKHVMLIHGDARDLSLLHEEGLQDMQEFIALTGSSEENIIACVAARKAGIRKTIARVDNYDYISMAEELDIGTIINKQTISAGHIYQMMLKADVSNMKSFTIMDADVAEFTVQKGSPITKKQIKDLGLPKGITLGGMVRDNTGMLINGLTQIQAGDHVVAFCVGDMIQKLQKYFY